MSRYVFDKIKHRAAKVVACTKCGRRMRLAKTFWHTENPWNVNADGTPRTREQIRAVLLEEAAVWVAEPASHATCPKKP